MGPESRFESCRKNPGHPGFIPAPKFSISDLPVALQSDLVLRYIKNCSDRTVNLIIDCVSSERPDDYIFADFRGTTLKRLASGWVVAVSFVGGPCKCPECSQEGAEPKDRSWEVTMVTACHCVFNTEEAKATRVEFFYEDASSRDSIRVLYGHEVEYAGPDEDRCLFGCITHDQAFALQLEQLRKERVDLWHGILRAAPFDMEHSQCIVISHPHGVAKHITVGRQVSKIQRSDVSEPYYTYEADTCPGSAGGQVVVLPGRDCPDPGWLPIVLHHRGVSGSGESFSGDRSAMGV